MKNTIIICGTILVVVSVHFYLKHSEMSVRMKCSSVLAQQEVQRKKNGNALTFDRAEALKELGFRVPKVEPQPEPDLVKTNFTIRGVPFGGPDKDSANDVYRLCLAQYGVKPENLFEK